MVLALAACCQAFAGDAEEERLAPEKLVADFRIARKALEKAHSGI
jgi:hypothetical protein